MAIVNSRIDWALSRIEELNDGDLRDLCDTNGVTTFRNYAERCRVLYERLHGIANEVDSH